MQVFNLFFKIVHKRRSSIIVYTVIFIVISLLNNSNAVDVTETFKESKAEISIIDRDHSELSKNLIKHFKKTNYVKPIKDNKEVIQDTLYYRDVDMIMIIPKNYESDMKAGKSIQIEYLRVPNSSDSVVMINKTNDYLTTLGSYLKCGYGVTDAIKSTDKILNQKLNVTYVHDKNATEKRPSFTFYYQFIAYVIPAISIFLIGIILITLNQTDIKHRMNCSAYPLWKRNAWLAISALVFTSIIWFIFNLVAHFMYYDSIKEMPYMRYLFLNTATVSVLSVSIACLVGFFFKSEKTLDMATNCITLALGFLTGIFIPLEILSKSVVSVAKFLPTYWYVKANELICTRITLSSSDISKIYEYMGIQLLFAAGIFIIALIVSKQKQVAS